MLNIQNSLQTSPRPVNKNSVVIEKKFDALLNDIINNFPALNQHRDDEDKSKLPAQLQRSLISLIMSLKKDQGITQDDIISTLKKFPDEIKRQFPDNIQMVFQLDQHDADNSLKESSYEYFVSGIQNCLTEGVELFNSNKREGEKIFLNTAELQLPPEIICNLFLHQSKLDQGSLACTNQFHHEASQDLYYSLLDIKNLDIKNEVDKLITAGKSKREIYVNRPELRKGRFVLCDETGRRLFEKRCLGGLKSIQLLNEDKVNVCDLEKKRDTVFEEIIQRLSKMTWEMINALPPHLNTFVRNMGHVMMRPDRVSQFDPISGMPFCNGVVRCLVDRSLTWDEVMNLSEDGITALSHRPFQRLFLDTGKVSFERAKTFTLADCLLLTNALTQDQLNKDLTTLDDVLEVGIFEFIKQIADCGVDPGLPHQKLFTFNELRRHL